MDFFYNELHETKWVELPFQTSDNFNLLYYIVYDYYNKCFPIKNKYVTSKRWKNAWLANSILVSIEHKCKQFKMYKLGTISQDAFTQNRNVLTGVVRSAKTTSPHPP